jgi:hypothetical protein
MHIDLDPPNGITGFSFGMPADEVKAAAAALGTVRVLDEGPPHKWRFMKIDTVLPQFAITFHIEDGRTLTSVEIWRPGSRPRATVSTSARPLTRRSRTSPWASAATSATTSPGTARRARTTRSRCTSLRCLPRRGGTTRRVLWSR